MSNYRQQQELHEEQEWFAENVGKYRCPYCDKVFDELTMCCHEVHGELIKEIEHEKHISSVC